MMWCRVSSIGLLEVKSGSNDTRSRFVCYAQEGNISLMCCACATPPPALILVFRATISVPRAVVKAALAVTFRTNGADAGSESVTVATDEVQPTHASTSTTNDTAFMLLLPCGDGGTNLSGTAASCRARSNCDPTDVSTTFSTATSSMQLCVSTILTRYIFCAIACLPSVLGPL